MPLPTVRDRVQPLLARWSLPCAVLLVALGLWQAPPPATPRTPARAGDAALYQSIVASMRTGEPFYTATARELESRGYATHPVFNWRLPTLASLQSRLPPWASIALLASLGVWTTATWLEHLGAALGRGRWVLLILLLSMLPAWVNATANVFHELWAGQIVALSLALHATGRLRLSLLAGAAALAIRELAIVYIFVMAFAAADDGRRREASMWLAIVAFFVAAYGVHVHEVLAAMPEGGLTNQWMGFGGWRTVLATAGVEPIFVALPSWAAIIGLPLVWAGLARWMTRSGWRVTLTVTAFFIVLAVAARPDNAYWGLMTAPLWALAITGLRGRSLTLHTRSSADIGSNQS